MLQSFWTYQCKQAQLPTKFHFSGRSWHFSPCCLLGCNPWCIGNWLFFPILANCYPITAPSYCQQLVQGKTHLIIKNTLCFISCFIIITKCIFWSTDVLACKLATATYVAYTPSDSSQKSESNWSLQLQSGYHRSGHLQDRSQISYIPWGWIRAGNICALSPLQCIAKFARILVSTSCNAQVAVKNRWSASAKADTRNLQHQFKDTINIFPFADSFNNSTYQWVVEE